MCVYVYMVCVSYVTWIAALMSFLSWDFVFSGISG